MYILINAFLVEGQGISMLLWGWAWGWGGGGENLIQSVFSCNPEKCMPKFKISHFLKLSNFLLLLYQDLRIFQDKQ